MVLTVLCQRPAGNDGADGADGQDGADGAQGPQGPQGPAGNDCSVDTNQTAMIF